MTAARTTLQLAAVPCTAKKPGLAGYKICRCRCATCTHANTNYQTRRERAIAYGQWAPYIDAEPVRAHIINTLRPAGLGWRTIATLAGVGATTIGALLWERPSRPRTRRMRPAVAAAILAIQPEVTNLAGGAHIDATGTRRRTQALAAMGWSLSEQARRVGREVRNHTYVLRLDRVSARVARDVATLYEQLAEAAPPPGRGRTRTLRWAAAQGWAPPAAWDDIDDPDATPNLADADDLVDEVAVERALKGDRTVTLTPAERRHAAAVARQRGIGSGALATALRVSGRAARGLLADRGAAA